MPGTPARRRAFRMAEVATATFDDTSLTDFSPYLMDVSLNQSRATEYDTTYDPTGVSRFEQGRIAMLRDGTISGSGRYQAAVHRAIARARRSVLNADEGESLSYEFGPGGRADGAIKQTGQMILTGFGITIPKTGIDEFTLTGQLNGQVTEGTFTSYAGGTSARVHGVPGFKAAVLIGGYDASRWFDTFSVNGSVGTTQDGGFQPPGDQQEYLATWGDHEFSAAGPWTRLRHTSLIEYLGADSGQITTLGPEGTVVGKPAILFTSLQTQFDEQGRYDDKVMHSLSMQASDNVGINGTWIAAKRAASAAETASSVAAVDLGFVPFGNGIVNIHCHSLAPSATATFRVAVNSQASGAGAVVNSVTVTGVDAATVTLPATYPRFVKVYCSSISTGSVNYSAAAGE